MQSEYLYPEVGNRFSPMVWEASDKPLAIDAAIRTRDHIFGELCAQPYSARGRCGSPRQVSDPLDH
jgi:hypothetical protein